MQLPINRVKRRWQMTQGKSQNHDVRKAGDVDVYVGGRIRALRNMCNITQDELGQKIGVSFQQVQKYEKGTNRCTRSGLVDIRRTSLNARSQRCFRRRSETVSRDGRLKAPLPWRT